MQPEISEVRFHRKLKGLAYTRVGTLGGTSVGISVEILGETLGACRWVMRGVNRASDRMAGLSRKVRVRVGHWIGASSQAVRLRT